MAISDLVVATTVPASRWTQWNIDGVIDLNNPYYTAQHTPDSASSGRSSTTSSHLPHGVREELDRLRATVSHLRSKNYHLTQQNTSAGADQARFLSEGERLHIER